MTILSGDVKLIASQVMDDVDSGGGAPTATVIQDGTSNSVFNDISEMDRAGGRVSLRKLFMSVQTPNTDTYLGGNLIVADAPADPNVSVTIFSTDDVFDRRTAARDRIESYLTKAGKIDGFLLENHIAGQRAIQIFHRKSAPAIPVGTTLYLAQDEGLSSEVSQYVRITKVTRTTRTFTEVVGNTIVDYEADVSTCQLSDALRYDFVGSSPSRLFQQSAGAGYANVRETLVADAARYYGASLTTAPIAVGAIAAAVSSIYTKLVPSAQSETALVDVSPTGGSQPVIDSSNGTVSYTTATDFYANTKLYLGSIIIPGSLSISCGATEIRDNGGNVVIGSSVVGTIDYRNSLITFSAAMGTLVGGKLISFKAGGAPTSVSDTAGIQVTTESRAYNYSLTILPTPAPATLSVSYRAQGKWYTLSDTAALGTLKGSDSTYGVGTVSYTTGTVSVTLGALPDAGSAIIFSWGNPASYFNRSAGITDPATVKFTVQHTGITPGDFTVSWNDGAVRTATADVGGNFSGSATGTVNYATGEVVLIPSTLPAGGGTFHVSYSHGAPETEEFQSPAQNAGTVTLALQTGNIRPGTVRLTLQFAAQVPSQLSASLASTAQQSFFKYVKDNGSGSLVDAAGATVGSINYTTGVISVAATSTVSLPYSKYSLQKVGTTNVLANNSDWLYPVDDYRNTFTGWGYQTVQAILDPQSAVSVTYRTMNSGSTVSEDVTGKPITVDLTKYYSESIIPGSVAFTLGGATYFDRSGSLYYNLNIFTGAATLGGTIDYATGTVTLSGWNPGGQNSLTMRSLLTSLDSTPVDSVSFRIPVSPIRSGSVQVRATKFSGGSVNVTASTSGVFSSADAIGSIDYETGVVRMRFGSWVTAAGKENEAYYSAGAVVDGMIFKPDYVYADTIKFNAVAYSYLPLDADMIGLDPVRLPQDGRVPIFREGDFAVIGHTGTVAAQAVSNGQTVNCGRVRLSRVRVIGANGVVIDTGYTTDLEAGTVTFTNVSGYAQPVTIEHRIEDMVQVSDVQISGKLAFTRQITHNYPAGSTVSSALVAGDLHATVPVLFDQYSWGNTFSDALVGNSATGTFNDVLAPIVVTNAGAVTERWAIQFTSATAFRVIGEHVGVIAIGNTASVLAPLNPATGQPYFTINPAGWGDGWAAGNVLRFNTTGALFPVWVVRTVQQGLETVTSDSFTILARGDVDRAA